MNRGLFVSVIIPVYNAEKMVGDCLESVFNSNYRNFEVIVVDDKSTDHSLGVIGKFPCRIIKMNNNVGAAAARDRGAEVSCGEILFFLDSDIVIEKDTLGQIVRTFEDRPKISALFCSYQKNTKPTDFFSVYKNLVHHYTHQTSLEDAATFCSGFGAIKRGVFFKVGGFDEGYKSLEDIELGYRLYQAGYEIYLNKKIQVTHCKQYSFLGLIKSDVLGRAIPWTQIMLNKRIFRNDLNTRMNNVLSIPVSFLMLFNLPSIYFLPQGVYVFALLFGLLIVLNHQFYLFVWREKGVVFTAKTILMSWFNYLYSGVGMIIGVLSFLNESYLKPRLQARL